MAMSDNSEKNLGSNEDDDKDDDNIGSSKSGNAGQGKANYMQSKNGDQVYLDTIYLLNTHVFVHMKIFTASELEEIILKGGAVFEPLNGPPA